VLNSGHQWGLDAGKATAEYADELRELLHDIWDVMWACAEERCPHRRHQCYRVAGNSGAATAEGECWFERRMKELKVTEASR
jgi:hypothetical protein